MTTKAATSTPLAMISAGHGPAPQPAAVVNTFDAAEIREAARDARTQIIVHHGRAFEVAGFHRVASHVEVCPVFTRLDSELQDISVRDLWRCLTGTPPRDERAGTRHLFCHGGSTNLRVLGAMFGLTRMVPARGCWTETLPDYEELARAAVLHRNALVVGLRGFGAQTDGLRVLRVDGVDPLLSAPGRYPLQYVVHIHIRRRQRGGNSFKPDGYLADVTTRVDADRVVWRTLRRRALAAEGLVA